MVVAGVLVVGACSGGGGDGEAGRAPTTDAAPPIEMTVTGAELVSPHKVLSELSPLVAGPALETVQHTFEATVEAPLLDGKPGSLRGVFTTDAEATAAGPDREMVYGTVRGAADRLVARTVNVRLTALAGPAGNDPIIVVAKIDWDVAAADGSLRTVRQGELEMIPAGGGRWQVAAYTLVSR